MANNSTINPHANNAMEKMKHEAAREVGVNLKEGYNGNLTAQDAGKIGGRMVKKMIEYAENHMS